MLVIRLMKKPKQFNQTNANYQTRYISKNQWIQDNTEKQDVDNEKIHHEFDVAFPCNFVFFFSVDKIKPNSAQQKVN